MARHAANSATGPRPRAYIAPSSGALSACVSGALNLSGPMIATVCSIAAVLAA
jgi:hypothetical protein